MKKDDIKDLSTKISTQKSKDFLDLIKDTSVEEETKKWALRLYPAISSFITFDEFYKECLDRAIKLRSLPKSEVEKLAKRSVENAEVFFKEASKTAKKNETNKP